MSKYCHLTMDKRLKLEALINAGISKKEIAFQLNISLSTVYRELQRGEYERLDSKTYKYYKSYSADISQRKYDFNKTSKGRNLKIGSDISLSKYIEERILIYRDSPDVVSWRISQGNFSCTLSTKTIYSYIDKGVFLRLTNRDLLFKSRRKTKPQRPIKRERKKSILNRCISERPLEILSRESFGHWELDTVVGKSDSRPCLLVLTERLTRREIIEKLNSRSQIEVYYALNRIERRTPNFKKIFKSITMDNGSEFLNQCLIEKSIKTKSNRTIAYYCHPYSSWERGSNENANKLIRRFIPKGKTMDKFSRNDIKHIENYINSYPRKILGYKTPQEMYDYFVANINNL